LTDKEKYIDYTLRHAVPLFFKPFWLDAFCADWKVVTGHYHEVLVFFVYNLEKKFKFKIIRNPYLTPYSGFLFTEKISEPAHRCAVMNEILKQLPDFDELHLDLHPDCETDYSSDDFVISTKRTNILSLPDMTEVYDGYKAALKRQIRKARNLVSVEERDDIGLFYKLYESTFEKQDKKAVTPFAALEKVWQLCKKMNCGRLLFARDHAGRVHAALLLTYDEETAYYLAGGTDAAFYGSGAMSLLMHSAIEISALSGRKKFDFEGSMLPGVNRFFKNFNPDEKLYTSISRMDSMLLQMIKKIKSR
jgi:lipid II:glycine glycyltransferase (peptidoglycan interpeptide bridge formation enzyme)